MDLYTNLGTEVMTEQRKALSKSVMMRTYFYMFGVTILSGIAACIGYSSGYYETLMNGPVWWLLFAVELLVVFLCHRTADRQNAPLAGVMLIVYSIVNGLTLSYIFAFFDLGSIFTVFFIAAGMFGGLAVFGTITKKDLSTLGTIGIMALLGLILLLIANLFVRSAALTLALSVLTLAIFIGITAYDGQRIRMLSNQATEQTVNTFAIIGALTLYLDFVNIFLNLLQLFGIKD